MKLVTFLCLSIMLTTLSPLFAQYPELDYLSSLHADNDVITYIQRAYTNMYIDPVPENEFNAVRAKNLGETFIDPNFGREWTFIYAGGATIMNSERKAWNADTSLFFLEGPASSSTRQLVLFDGKTAAQLRTITIEGLPSWNGGTTRTAFRWMPHEPELLFYVDKNKMYTVNVNTLEKSLYEEFDATSFTMTHYDLAGGDGNDVAPNGDMLMGNKGENNFVYNVIEKKVVRLQDGQRVFLDPSQPFPTFNLGDIDYACCFADHIVAVDDGRGGTFLLNANGGTVQELYRRTPHMDPTFYKHDNKLYPGIFIRYNSADASFYSGRGYSSKTNGGYFHAWDPDDPKTFVRFTMDQWPSTTLGSGGQHSLNRFDGSTGILCQHGPGLYPDQLPNWEARFGECYEMALFDGESEMPRRFAHHYIGYKDKVSSSDQPEGHISPDGQFAIIKTKWGWYKIKLVYPRLTKSVVDSLLDAASDVRQNDKGSSLPHDFQLNQNYPNPFNPQTTISYSLPTAEHVSVVIYDTLARRRDVLVDEYQNAGLYSMTVQAESWPSGIYFCRLRAGDFEATRKMQLVR